MDTNSTPPRPVHPSLTRRKFLKTTLPVAIGIGMTASVISRSVPIEERGYGSGTYGSGTMGAASLKLT